MAIDRREYARFLSATTQNRLRAEIKRPRHLKNPSFTGSNQEIQLREVLHSGLGAAVCLMYAVANCQVATAAVIAQDTLQTAVAAPPDVIEQEDFFDVFAAEKFVYDTNVYRLSPQVTDLDTLDGIGPHPSREDHIDTTSLGLDGQWSRGRQTVIVDLDVDENRFDDNTNLNNTSDNGKVIWKWNVGGVLNGQVGATYTSSLAGFVNATDYSRNIVDATSYFGSARYQVGPHWAIFGGVMDTGVTFANVSLQGNDVHFKAVEGGAECVINPTNSLGFGYRYTDAAYAQLVTGNGDFREDIEYFYDKYAFTEKTLIDASVGYLKRDYTNTSFGSFSGAIWSVSFQWKPTDKLNLNVDAWRRLQAYLTAQTEYFVAKGGSIAPGWTASEKVTLSLSWSLEDQDYVASSGSNATAMGLRRDTVHRSGVDLAYTPARYLIFDFAYAYEKRNSNMSQYSYNDQLASAKVTVKF